MNRYEYPAKLVKVVDGDTLDLFVDVGFRIWVEVRVRLLGVDAPETHGVKRDSEEYRRGSETSKWVSSWIPDGEFLVVTKKTGKYGRWLADIQRADGAWLAASLEAWLAGRGWL